MLSIVNIELLGAPHAYAISYFCDFALSVSVASDASHFCYPTNLCSSLKTQLKHLLLRDAFREVPFLWLPQGALPALVLASTALYWSDMFFCPPHSSVNSLRTRTKYFSYTKQQRSATEASCTVSWECTRLWHPFPLATSPAPLCSQSLGTGEHSVNTCGDEFMDKGLKAHTESFVSSPMFRI